MPSVEEYKRQKLEGEERRKAAPAIAIAECKLIKSEIAQIEQELILKQTEFQKTGLDKTINSELAHIEGLNEKIANAAKQITSGALSTEGFLALKMELKSHEANLADLKEAKKIQESVLASFQEKLRPLKKQWYHQREIVKGGFVDKAVADLVEHSKDKFEELLKIYICVSGIYECSVINSREMYMSVGIALFSKYGEFPNHKTSSDFVEKMIDDLVDNG